MSSVFEAVMLLCFAAAWPAAIHKSWVSRTARGKSVAFLVIVLVGYFAGIAYKITGNLDKVVAMYAFNACLVSVDLGLYVRNVRLDRLSRRS
ncbi:hypothetical protein KKD52_15275 [Myxococcota bacterium]|jgi:hypothetical protein|nr:hypothetical protein [Myxococcota bacterium]MBU1413670.1 hypothetical protein [Myxococcota bacterium]MBU1511713.1 hypothetical protein [Myxococcota bacterium]PKN26821.1 MAG: hypothetical protein CVU65_04510 [Deltaproteobacteria bacterium HGW-Deltaproteobacteria-22]